VPKHYFSCRKRQSGQQEAGISSIAGKNSLGVAESIFVSLQRMGKLRQNAMKLRYTGSGYLLVTGSWVVYLSIQGEAYKAPNINLTELSRMGGINSICGFNEQCIFANAFHMANIEFHFMAGQSGFVAALVSGVLYQDTNLQQNIFRSIYSLGLAGGVKTGAGFLQFTWALGNEGQGFCLRDAKFHLGLSNVF